MADSSSSTKFQISKLNGANYFTWKFRMNKLLVKDKLWNTVNDDIPATPTAAWTQSDSEAQAVISLSIEDDQIPIIRDCVSAKEMWDAIKNHYLKQNISNKTRIIRKICNSKFKDGGNINQHIQDMAELFQQLTEMGDEILAKNYSRHFLLSSLPDSYNALITAIESKDDKDLTMSFVQNKIIEEYERRKSVNSTEDCETTLKINYGKRIECYFCKKGGIVKKNCFKYLAWKSKQDSNGNWRRSQKQHVNIVNEAEEYLFVLNASSKDWILDSGATCHVCRNKNLFSTFDSTYKEKINMPNGEMCMSSGKGTVILSLINSNGKISKAKIQDVFYVPEIEGNLISVSKLTNKGYQVIFNKTKCEINFNNVNIAVADLNGKLYILRKTAKNTICAVEKDEHRKNCVHYWHRILGHRDLTVVKNLNSSGVIQPITINSCNMNEFCEICPQGKMTRMTFSSRNEIKTREILDLIHSDVCGPMQTNSVSGKKYLLTFIDDFSRYAVIYFLREKSEVLEKFKEFVQFVKTKFNKTPKIIRSDRGGEYCGHQFKNFLKEEGIQQQLTAPYSPQQNGIAERKNRTLMEMARCMLIESKLQKSLWAEAVNTANYIQNRLPCKPLINKTPFEIWEGEKPNLNNMKIFGSRCFVKLPDQHRRKLDEKSIEMRFVGYDYNSKAYRCFNQENCSLKISRDVVFIEKSCAQPKINNNKNGETSIKSNNSSGSGGEFTVEFKNTSYSEEILEEEEAANESFIISNKCDDSEICNDTDADVSYEEISPEPRRSSRQTKGNAPERYADKNDEIYKDPKTLEQAMKSKDREKWVKAMKEEMDTLKNNGTWQLIKPPKDANIVGSKWIFKRKTNYDESEYKYKARLVAQGFSQKYGTDYDEIFDQ
jgi:transposase InsO family protein